MEIAYSKQAFKSIRSINNPYKQRIKSAIEQIPRGDIKSFKDIKIFTD